MKIPGISELILKNIHKDKYQKYLELMPDLKSDKNEKLLAAILTIIASILLGIFAINPTLSTIASLQKRLEDDKFIEQRLQEKINNLSLLEKKYETIQKDLPLVFDAIPNSAEIATLAAILQQISTSDTIELDDLQTLNVELSKETLAKKKYSSYQFTVATKGNYVDLIKLLDKLINFQRIITVDEISITKSSTINDSLLQFNLKGTVYFKQ